VPPTPHPFVAFVVPTHPQVLSRSQKQPFLARRWRALDSVIVPVRVYGMSIWTPAQAKYLAQPTELCLRTPAYCRAPGHTRRHVSSVQVNDMGLIKLMIFYITCMFKKKQKKKKKKIEYKILKHPA